MTHFVDYDAIAPRYDQRFVEHDYAGVERTLAELVAPGVDVLDVGCGTGRWLRHVVGRGARAVGLDTSSGMLAEAREREPVTPLVLGSATRLPFRPASFDVVFAVNALHHFDDVRGFLAEARRVLRPGGQFLSVGLDPSREEDDWYVYDFFPGTRAVDIERYPRTDALRALLAELDFVDETTFVAQRWDEAVEAEAFIARGGVSRTICSQLALLSEEEHRAGLARIEDARRVASTKGEPLVLRGRLQLFGTRATVPAP